MIQQISPRELAMRLEAGEAIFLLDVRQPDEHAFAKIAPCILISLGELPGRVEEIPEDATIVVYCHHGVRSLTGAAIVARAGRSPVFSLAGGIDAWSVLVDPNIPRY